MKLNPFPRNHRRRSQLEAVYSHQNSVRCFSRDGIEVVAKVNLRYRLLDVEPQPVGILYLRGSVEDTLREQISKRSASDVMEQHQEILSHIVAEASINLVARVQVLDVAWLDLSGVNSYFRAYQAGELVVELPSVFTASPRGRLSGLARLGTVSP